MRPILPSGNRGTSVLKAAMRCTRSRSLASCRVFSLPFLGGSKGNKAKSKEFLQQLLSDTPDQQKIDRMLAELVASPVPFRASSLGGGPWQVVYTRGPLLWQTLTNSGGSKAGKQRKGNKAYQDFQPDSSTVVNYGEILGDKVYVTADGTFSTIGQSKCTPVEIKANIERGTLHIFGGQIPMPIKGSGLVILAYTDGHAVRIFKNKGGSISVQVKQSLLQ